MSDYSKKTVADLQEILKSRGLQHTGKKAELIARLQENDKAVTAQAEPAAEPEASQDATSDATIVPPAAAAAAPPAPAPAPAPAADEPAPVPTPSAAPEASTSADASASAASKPSSDPAAAAAADQVAPSPDTALATTINYALNLPTESLDDEAERRKKRAERFGLNNPAAGNGQVDPEEAKKAARAEKFGTAVTGLGKLNEALPTERIRGPKASKEHSEDTVMDDPGLIRRGRGGSRGGRLWHRDGRKRSQRTPDRPTGVHKAVAYSNEKDRAAAEARKKRFAQAT